MHFQIINVVWGIRYIDTFLKLSLPTQFAEGNLKGLRLKPNYIIYTDSIGKNYIVQAPIYKKLTACTNVIFRKITINAKQNSFDLLLKCHADAIQQANKIKAPIILLSPDALLSINVLSYLTKKVEDKKRLIALCSARMSLEKYREIITTRSLLSKQEIQWSPQELAVMTIKHLHRRGQCLLMGGDCISSHPSHMYWKLDVNNLVAKCYHLHPLLIWPEADHIYPSISVDGKDFLEKICPNKKSWEVVQDCREIALFEISSDQQFKEDIQIPINRFHLKKWIVENTSKAHHYFMKHTIILGDGIEKEEWKEKIIEANSFLETIFDRKFSTIKIVSLINVLVSTCSDFLIFHLILVYYVLTKKKKLNWKKFKNHFLYLFKYRAFPLDTLQINNHEKKVD